MTREDSAVDGVPLPRSGPADRLRTLILGGVGSVPTTGSAISAILGVLWRPAYEKRVESFLGLVVAELNRLDDRIDNLDELLKRDVSISVGLAAGAAAGRSHEEVKHRFLANATVGITIDRSWDLRADFALLMVQIVDTLTVSHISILRALSRVPSEYTQSALEFRAPTMPLKVVVARSVPALDDVAAEAICADLVARNLVSYRYQPLDIWPILKFMPPRVTDLGRTLLEFISTVPANANPPSSQ